MIAREVMEFKAERLAAERNASMGRTVVSLPVPTRDQIPYMERDDRDEGETDSFHSFDRHLLTVTNHFKQTLKLWIWMRSSQTGESESGDCIGLNRSLDEKTTLGRRHCF
jgi:hypothetical protein